MVRHSELSIGSHYHGRVSSCEGVWLASLKYLLSSSLRNSLCTRVTLGNKKMGYISAKFIPPTLTLSLPLPRRDEFWYFPQTACSGLDCFLFVCLFSPERKMSKGLYFVIQHTGLGRIHTSIIKKKASLGLLCICVCTCVWVLPTCGCTKPRPGWTKSLQTCCENIQLEPTDHVHKEVPLLKKAPQEEGKKGAEKTGSLPFRGLYCFNQKQLWPV